jgi:hypothetical protein
MTKTIFISCGQYTPAEKELGKQISQMVRDLTDCVPFFAEEVSDLNGLDANILNALQDCVGFITVLHPRGEIKRTKDSIVRASVWIEQEIAIATYIHRAEKRPLPIIAFKHKSVGREGIRDLLHLNPFEFSDEAEILAELPKRLATWKSLKPSGVELPRPYDESQRTFVKSKLASLTADGRDVLRYLLRFGPCQRFTILHKAQLETDEMIPILTSVVRTGLLLQRDKQLSVNPNFERIMQDELFPRNEHTPERCFVIE